MKILLTGATGFVGLNIAEALLARGDEAVLYDAAPMPGEAGTALRSHAGTWRLVEGDVRDGRALLAAMAGCDAVVHAAVITAGVARERADAATIVDVNVRGTTMVLEAARQAGIRRVVHLSSAGVYGDNSFTGDIIDEEATAPAPSTMYAITKYAGERIALRYRVLHGMDVRCLRPGYVFGPWERNTGVRDTLSPVLQASVAAARGEAAILPRACVRDWVYSRDVAGAVLALIDRRQVTGAVFNCAGPEAWALEAWCERLQRVHPGFSYRYGAPGNIVLHQDVDRRPMSLRRLREDAGYDPVYGLDRSWADYREWISRQPRFGETPL
jgi:nucleoside-diphosphate-sugar epimerase